LPNVRITPLDNPKKKCTINRHGSWGIKKMNVQMSMTSFCIYGH
jgi:hypothetical protein